jgi:hypothetical protein
MKKLIIIIFAAASFSFSYADTNDRNKNQEKYTAAEQDFIQACIEKKADCFTKAKEGCCFPEVVIIDQNDRIFAKGDLDNPVIKNFIIVSDFLTGVLGTEYYRMSMITPTFGVTPIASR